VMQWNRVMFRWVAMAVVVECLDVWINEVKWRKHCSTNE